MTECSFCAFEEQTSCILTCRFYFGYFMEVTTRYSFWEFSGKEKNINKKITPHLLRLALTHCKVSLTKYEDRHFFHHVPQANSKRFSFANR